MARMVDEGQARARAELQRRQMLQRQELEAVYDWYALTCPCNLPPGKCRIHPRARLKQRPPDRPDGFFQPCDPLWRVWIMLAGRGGGKTQAGAKFVNEQVEKHGVKDVVIVNATTGDTRDVNVLGISGLVETSPPWCKAVFIPSRAQVEWRTSNGNGDFIARAYLRTSEVPDGLRGLNASLVWADEPGKWIKDEETWFQIRLILRNKVSPPPRCVVTGTPTSSPLFYVFQKKFSDSERTKFFMVHWHTRENIDHLDEQSVIEMEEALEGSLRGLEELSGMIVRRKEGALWGPEDFEKPGFRIDSIPEMDYVGVAVDPSGGGKRPGASESGIIVGGRLPPKRGSYLSRGVVLDDRSTAGNPGDWGKAAIRAYCDWQANEIIAEKNQGGEMVRHVLETVPAEDGYPSGKNIPVKLVHAALGKMARAEPIQGLYQANRIQHMKGPLAALEEQMVQFLPGKHGQMLDRVDALVWLFAESIIEHDSGGESGPIVIGGARDPFIYQGMPRPWADRD